MKTFILSLLLALVPTLAFSVQYEWLWKANFPFINIEIEKFTPDSRQIAIYDYEGLLIPEENPNKLYFLDVLDGSILDSVQFGSYHIKNLCFSHDGNLMATDGDDNNMVIFRTKSWEVIDSITLSSRAGILKFTRDNKNIIFENDSFHIYNLDSGKIIKSFFKTPYDSLITNTAYTYHGEFDISPDDKNIVYTCCIS